MNKRTRLTRSELVEIVSDRLNDDTLAEESIAEAERAAAGEALSDQSVKARWQVQDALAILDETIAYWGESASTHSKECWKSHPACLAVEVKSALEGGKG
ncbi:hypothetical protein ACFSWE_15620 [Leucobacter albus]|uniref:Uncharacterized protein n=1 Tax=Leucobacter albus TaxID=272210 RepID=A0ABW3TVZ6_9MICO